MIRKLVIILVLLNISIVGNASIFKRKSKIETIRIGVNTPLQSEVIDFIINNYKNEDFIMERVEYNNYNKLVEDLLKKRIDIGFFKDLDTLKKRSMSNKDRLVLLGEGYFDGLGIYSKNLDSIKGIRKKIVIPKDSKLRSLKLIESTGLIELEGEEIGKNPRNIEIVEMEKRLIHRVIDDVDAVILDGSQVIKQDTINYEDGIYLEEYDSRYSRVLAYRVKNKKLIYLERLGELITSIEVEKYIKTKYGNSIIIER